MKSWGPVLGLVGLLAGTPAFAEVKRRAIVIAYNKSDDSSLKPLRFADDDGVLWAETLQRLGVETTLLVEPDQNTLKSDRPVLKGARPPTRGNLEIEVAKLRSAALADSEAGRETEVFVVYVGHGNSDARGRAYFTLKGDRLYQDNLYTRVVDLLEADYVHLIVDACYASGVVGSRGTPDPDREAELVRLLERGQLTSRSHVGVLFAQSESGEAFEWSEYQAGVFSHLTRSGLIGGADINTDGMVEYSELAAFVTSALAGIEDKRAQLKVYAFAPPHALRRPLIGPFPRGITLVLPAYSELERISIDDDQGFRLADVRRTRGEPLELHLPERPIYWVRTPDFEGQFKGEQLSSGNLQLKPRELQVRGPAEAALRRGLFLVPFNRTYYAKYMTEARLPPISYRLELPGRPPLGGKELLSASELAELRALQSVSEPSTLVNLGFGITAAEAPVTGELLLGPNVVLQTIPQPYYFSIGFGYGQTFGTDGPATVRRFGAHAAGGLQPQWEIAPFVEGAIGCAVLFPSIPTGESDMPLAIGGRAVSGVSVSLPVGQLRAGIVLGAEHFSLNGQAQWDRYYGLELMVTR